MMDLGEGERCQGHGAQREEVALERESAGWTRPGIPLHLHVGVYLPYSVCPEPWPCPFFWIVLPVVLEKVPSHKRLPTKRMGL